MLKHEIIVHEWKKRTSSMGQKTGDQCQIQRRFGIHWAGGNGRKKVGNSGNSATFISALIN